MTARHIGATDIISHSAVPEMPGTYVLGVFESRVTLYSQQVRALNLVYALLKEGKIGKTSKVAVIGGGAAGITAAAAAASQGCRVLLIEQAAVLMPLQQSNRSRWLHPHIYDWPAEHASKTDAGLPLLTWKAAAAGEVASNLSSAFRKLPFPSRIREVLGVTNVRVHEPRGGRLMVTWHPVPAHHPNRRERRKYDDDFVEAVILAVGFGVEEPRTEVPTVSYWSNDDLDQQDVMQLGERVRILVSGNGDGGLIDLLRASLVGFRHDTMIQEFFGGVDITALKKELLSIEERARRDNDIEEMYRRYKRLSVPAKIKRAIESRMHKHREVTLNAASHIPINRNSSILNRFLAMQLLDLGVDFIGSPIKSVTSQNQKHFVVFEDGTSGDYDRIVLRHGPTPAIRKYFPRVEELCEVLRGRSELDQSRYPIWSEGFYLSSSPTGMRMKQKTPATESGGVATEDTIVAVQVTIDDDFESYPPEKLQDVIQEFQRKLDSDAPPPPVIRTEPGSVIVTLAVPSDAAERLIWMIRQGEFSRHNVQDAQILDEPVPADMRLYFAELVQGLEDRRRHNPAISEQLSPDLVKGLVDAGIHFGHRTSRWNPKMKPYIHGKRNMVHIIDVRETVKGLLRAKKFLRQIVASGKDILFVGTKRQAQHAVEDEARRCNMPYVSERWLGGMLTNFSTIRTRLKRLDELEKLWDTGQIESYSKKMKATLDRERNKIATNLGGIRNMARIPGALFVIDTRREHIAVTEARKLGVPVVALIDTDSDPDLVDLPIPGNDDARHAIAIIMRELADVIVDGKEDRADAGASSRRRGRIFRTRGDGSSDTSSDDAGGGVDVNEPVIASY